MRVLGAFIDEPRKRLLRAAIIAVADFWVIPASSTAGLVVYYRRSIRGLVAFSHELGPLEMEVLGLVDKAGPTDVTTVQALLASNGSALAYTTVMTVLVRLREKGALRREKQGKRYVYTVARRGTALKSSMLKRIQSALFKGASPLVALLDADKLSSEELRELRRWVNARLRERSE